MSESGDVSPRTASLSALAASPVTAFIGRVSLSAIFLFSGIVKLTHFGDATSEMARHDLPLPAVVAALVIVVQLAGSALLLTRRFAHVGAAMLGAFTVLATLIAHAPWSTPPTVVVPQFVLLLMNLGLFGGFLVVFCSRART